MKRTVLAAATLAMAAVGGTPAQAQRAEHFHESVKSFVTADAPVILIRNVRVIPGDGGPAIEGQSILIRDGRIEKIGAGLKAPRKAQIVDGEGMTAMPGLVMLHEHLFYPVERGQSGLWAAVQPVAFPRLYLASGLTTIRTAGAMEPVNELQIKRAIEEGRMAGPDIDVTGPYLEGPGSWLTQAEPVETAEEARRIVNFWADQGATSFKAYNYVSREVLGAAADEAHKRGLKITGHLCSVTFAEAADLGVDDLEHGLSAATDFLADKKPDECPEYRWAPHVAGLDVDSEAVQSLIAKLVENDVAITSTLAVLADFGSHQKHPTPQSLEVRTGDARARYLERKERALAAVAEGRSKNDEAVAVEMAFERAFVEAGGLLVSGSDPTGIGGVIAGFGSLWQVEMLVEAGFTPLEALKISSYNGAQYLGRLDEIGTLAPGKRADIVLVRGNPDETIADIQKVETVFRDGVGYDSKKLIESTKDLVGR
jgi:imidazolonepropionase-like amidohydrolase